MTKEKRLPWFTLIMLFTATVMSFLDRQVLSILAPRIISEFGITNTSYSHIVFAFQLSYTAMSAAGGYLVDRFGVKLGLGVSLALWSAASAAHAFVRSVFGFGLARFVLGIGEGACFPAAIRGAAECAPSEQRSFATGFVIAGSALGAVIAPPLTVFLASRFGWRAAFLSTGLLGFVWVFVWSFRRKESRKVREVQPHAQLAWKVVLHDPRLLWMMAARFVFDPVFYFYMFWIPQFLLRKHGMSVESIGNRMWIPFLTLGITQMFCGRLTDRLIARGLEPVAAKRRMLFASAAITPVSWFAGLAPNPLWAIGFMSVLLFAHAIWITNYLALVRDIFPLEHNATVVGLTGMAGGIGGMLSTLAIGPVADHYSFVPVFAASGLVYPLALVFVFFSIRSHRLEPKEYEALT